MQSNRTCKVDGCDVSVRARGWCAKHYREMYSSTLHRKSCETCGDEFSAERPERRFCSLRCFGQSRRKRHSLICEGCGAEFEVPTNRVESGVRCCSMACRPLATAKRNQARDRCARCGGSVPRRRKYCSRGCRFEFRTIDNRGYVRILVPEHPNAHVTGYIFEHRYVMEQHLGRLLFPTETVHHMNGDRADNRLENLELWAGSHKSGQRVTDLVADAVDVLRRYAPQMLA